jgi:hypothetical protein
MFATGPNRFTHQGHKAAVDEPADLGAAKPRTIKNSCVAPLWPGVASMASARRCSALSIIGTATTPAAELDTSRIRRLLSSPRSIPLRICLAQSIVPVVGEPPKRHVARMRLSYANSES